MDPALKQRLVGAAVLVALAVIFLPMVVQGPAPDSGVSDLPLEVPDAPTEGFETRELPLIGPEPAPEGGALGMPAPAEGDAPSDTLPATSATPPDDDAAELAAEPAAAATPDSEDAAELAAAPASPPPAAPEDDARMFPAATAGGDYAVSWGSFSTAEAAQASVAALRASQLPAFRETVRVNGKTVHRVRIGPYATRPEAEAARLRAAHVRDDMNAQVITLDARPTDATAAAGATPAAARPAPAVADTGFAVQLAAYSSQADADAMVAKARAAGFSAFTERVNTEQGVLVRVRVGPVATRAEAEQLQGQVRGRLGIDGLVRPHP